MLVAALVVLPALLAMTYLASVDRRSAEERTLAENLRLAHSIAQRQAAVLDGARRLLVTLADAPTLQGQNARRCDAFLGKVLRSHPGYINISTANLDGSLFCSGIPLDRSLLMSATHLAWFRLALGTRETAIGESRVTATNGKPAIIISQPVFDSTGAVIRVIAAGVGIDRLGQTFADADLPTGSTISLFDTSGAILARYPGGAEWIGRHIPDRLRLSSGRTASGKVTDERGPDGIERLYVVAPVKPEFPVGLSVALGVNRTAAFANSDRIIRRDAVVLVLVVIAAILAGLIGGQALIIRPVTSLKMVMRRLASGDLAARAQLSPAAPGIGDLADAVNVMAAALDARMRERNDAERQVREANERTRFALAAAGVGIWQVDFTTKRVYCSDICAAMHGLESQAVERDFEVCVASIHADDRAHVIQEMRDAIAARRDATLDYRTTWPNGTTRRICSTARFVYDADGRATQSAGVATDVTERRALQEQLTQSQKMDALGQLAGGIAHDFNNLLTVILGNTDIALAEEAPDSVTSGSLREIREAAARAAQLTRQLLAFSRKQPLTPKPVDVDELVAQVTPMLQRVIGEDIAVQIALNAGAGATLTDPMQLEQALINLAVNARDAMARGGTLSISTGIVPLTAATIAHRRLCLNPGEYVTIAVKDTGVGMSRDVLARAFEPFFTTKEVGKGTGLGLSSVFGSVKQSGGQVIAESAPNQGTTITIFLPRLHLQMESNHADTSGAPAVDRRVGTVLLVEDEPAVRDLAFRSLSKAGYIVLVATDAASALRLARAHHGRIDYLLSDVVMPGLTVADLIAGLRQLWPDVGIVLMSGYPDAEMQRRGLRMEEYPIIQKPFAIDALPYELEAALARRDAEGAVGA